MTTDLDLDDVCNGHPEAQKELAELRANNEWISVDVRLPEQGQEVLVYMPEMIEVTIYHGDSIDLRANLERAEGELAAAQAKAASDYTGLLRHNQELANSLRAEQSACDGFKAELARLREPVDDIAKRVFYAVAEGESEKESVIPADIARRLAAQLAERNAQLASFRDIVLNQRGALSENGMTSDQVNDVLGEFDAAIQGGKP